MAHFRFAFALLVLTAAAPAQRVYNGVLPTNLTIDNNAAGSTILVGAQPGEFFVVQQFPTTQTGFLGTMLHWGTWQSDNLMDGQFGAGAWGRTAVTATDWAILSVDACAHLHGTADPNAPLSEMTRSIVSPSSPVPGAPFGTTGLITAFAAPLTIDGSTALILDNFRWNTQAGPNSPTWTACGYSTTSHGFSGWLVVRFEFTFTAA